MAKKKHFDPSFIYILLFAFNLFDFIIFDYFMLSSTSSLIPRIVIEGVQVIVGFMLMVAGVVYVFDYGFFFKTWRLAGQYGGYSLHYCAVSIFGHGLLLANVVTLLVLGPSFMTTGIFDAMVITISFGIMIASIGVYEPRSKELTAASPLPTTATPSSPFTYR